MARTIAAIDIGSRSIRAVELSDPSKMRPTLLRHAEIALPPGAVSRGEVIEPNTVSAAIKQLWSRGGFKTKNVVLGMGNQRVLARDLSVRKMPLAQIRESLPFEVQEMLPVPVGDALLDFYPISESTGEHGPMVNGLLIAAVKEAVLGNVRAAQMAGLSTADVDLIPFALSRAVVSRAGVNDTVAVVDMGAETTSIIIVRGGIPQFVRIIPTGGNDLTEAIRSSLETDSENAESIKRRLGLASEIGSIDDKPAVDVIYQVVNEQLTSLRNTIVYYTNTRPHDPVVRILLSGGGARLSGLSAALSELTRLPVDLVDSLGSVELGRGLDRENLQASASSLTVAVGLALGSAA